MIRPKSLLPVTRPTLKKMFRFADPSYIVSYIVVYKTILQKNFQKLSRKVSKPFSLFASVPGKWERNH